MKINKDDYLLLTGLAEFHFKFAEYVREADQEMFYRAIDYAKTYTKVEGMVFDYWHEDHKKFLEELNHMFLKLQARFDRLVDKVGDEEKAKRMWIKKKNTSSEDVLGFERYLENFIRHAKELDYDAFDLNDWENYMKICQKIKDPKFLEFAAQKMTKVLGSEHEFVKGLKNV